MRIVQFKQHPDMAPVWFNADHVAAVVAGSSGRPTMVETVGGGTYSIFEAAETVMDDIAKAEDEG